MRLTWMTSKRVTGEAYTFDGNFALTTVGKYEPVEVKVNIIYTETAAEAFQSVRALFEARTATQLKWLPAGATSGADQYETKTVGYITAMDYPPIDSTSAVSYTHLTLPTILRV